MNFRAGRDICRAGRRPRRVFASDQEVIWAENENPERRRPAPPLPNLYECLHLARPQIPGNQGEERPPLELEDNGAPIGTPMGRAADYNEFESFQASA